MRRARRLLLYVFPDPSRLKHETNISQLHGEAAEAAKKAGVKEISISISHSDTQAIAIAVASF
jgi:fatty acid synthase subunit alpha